MRALHVVNHWDSNPTEIGLHKLIENEDAYLRNKLKKVSLEYANTVHGEANPVREAGGPPDGFAGILSSALPSHSLD